MGARTWSLAGLPRFGELCIVQRLGFRCLAISLGLLLASRVTGQTFTTLHSFTSGDGGYPDGALSVSGNTLYGTANSGYGTVFAVTTDGMGFTNLYSFTAPSALPPYGNSDGNTPYAGLILSGNTMYGTAVFSGGGGNGTVFAVNTDGTGFTNLHNFTATSGPYPSTNSDGANPYAGLILSGNTLYGTAYAGGRVGWGTVFAVNIDGTGFTNLHSFTAGPYPSPKSDGASPYGRLILSGNVLYGTAGGGGSARIGVVFAINTDGTGLTNLHSFSASGGSSGNPTNSEGVNPNGPLILSGNTLYGTAARGGSAAGGTVFAVNTDGTGFTNLHSFTANSDGVDPIGALVLLGNTLYGTASDGGSYNAGTLFAVNTDGTGFRNLHNFTAIAGTLYTNSDGAFPYAGLV